MKELFENLIDKYQSLTVEETLYFGIALLVVIIGFTLLIQSFSRKKKNDNSLEENMQILQDLVSNDSENKLNEVE